jgi:hypothetical protein
VPTEIGGQGLQVPEDLETYGDLGLRIPFALQLRAFSESLNSNAATSDLPAPYQRSLELRRSDLREIYEELSATTAVYHGSQKCAHRKCHRNNIDVALVDGIYSPGPRMWRWCDAELDPDRAAKITKKLGMGSSKLDMFPPLPPAGFFASILPDQVVGPSSLSSASSLAVTTNNQPGDETLRTVENLLRMPKHSGNATTTTPEFNLGDSLSFFEDNQQQFLDPQPRSLTTLPNENPFNLTNEDMIFLPHQQQQHQLPLNFPIDPALDYTAMFPTITPSQPDSISAAATAASTTRTTPASALPRDPTVMDFFRFDDAAVSSNPPGKLLPDVLGRGDLWASGEVMVGEARVEEEGIFDFDRDFGMEFEYGSL